MLSELMIPIKASDLADPYGEDKMAAESGSALVESLRDAICGKTIESVWQGSAANIRILLSDGRHLDIAGDFVVTMAEPIRAGNPPETLSA